jgi:NADH:ubiquinone oxidoreductase subunit 5 (subunit L)/multisubunit Na+/H+ antiporter MnhA subunit
VYLVIVFIPILNLIISFTVGRFLGQKYTSILVISNILLSFFISLFLFFEVALIKYYRYVKLFTWINTGVLKLK